MAKMAVSKQWTRVRTLGRGASGAEVFLAADDASGELFAVKSARASGAAALRREQGIMSGLRSPRVVSCIGGRAGRDGSYQLFLEYAPGGSLADEVQKSGRLEDHAIRAYTADVAAGLAYLHGESMVHGDVKARNVMIGADGRAKLADFGCARKSGAPIIGGTPAFMAPEVARGEEQGLAADVWALGCTVVELATGRAPWSCADSNPLAAMHRIGYTDAVPEVPQWVSADAKDFLGMCFVRRPSHRCTAAQLLEHPFLASATGCDAKLEDVRRKWVSPKSTLDAAFWESESDAEEGDEELSHSSTAERINALACSASPLPADWDSDEGWIDVLSAAPAEAQGAVAVPAVETITSEGPSGAEPTFSTLPWSTAAIAVSSPREKPMAIQSATIGGISVWEIPFAVNYRVLLDYFATESMKNSVRPKHILLRAASLCFSDHTALYSLPHRLARLISRFHEKITCPGKGSTSYDRVVISQLGRHAAHRDRIFHRGNDRVDAESAASQQTY